MVQPSVEMVPPNVGIGPKLAVTQPAILARRIAVTLVRHHVDEALVEINRALNGALPWACSRQLAAEPRFGISHSGASLPVSELLDRLAAATNSHWEMVQDHVRLYRSGEDAASVVALARKTASDPTALAFLEQLYQPVQFGIQPPRTLLSCAATDAPTQEQLRQLLERSNPPEAAIRLAGAWRAAWAVPAVLRISAREAKSTLPKNREVIEDAAAGSGTVTTTVTQYATGSATIQQTALFALGAIASPAAVDGLIDAFVKEHDQQVRIVMINVLAATGDVRAWETILPSVTDANPMVSVQAMSALALGHFSADEQSLRAHDRAAELVEAAYRQPRACSGLAAAYVLANLGEPGARRLIALAKQRYQEDRLGIAVRDMIEPHLAATLVGDCWQDEAHAAWALPLAVRAGVPPAIKRAIEMVSAPGTVSEALVSALAQTRRDDALDVLMRNCDPSTAVDVRRVVAAHLVATRAPQAEAALVKLTDDADAGVRSAALGSMVGMDHPQLVAHLSSDPDVSVRRACIVALSKMTRTGDDVAIARALTDSDARIRQLAVRALQGIVSATDSRADRAALRPLVSAARQSESQQVVAKQLQQLLQALEQKAGTTSDW